MSKNSVHANIKVGNEWLAKLNQPNRPYGRNKNTKKGK